MPAPRYVVAWPQYVDIATTVLPLLGAWGARRLSWRDPVGQVGLAWGAQFALSLVQLAGVLAGRLVYTRWGSAVAMLLLPLMLVPPLLTWMGPRAARWRAPLLTLFAIGGLGTLLTLRSGRQLTLFYQSPSHLVLALLALGMLVAQARRASDPQGPPAERGWLWVGGGHLVYFVATMVGRPLIEFVLLLLGRSATRDAAMGLLLLYSATMVTITWGLWMERRTVARAPFGPSVSPAA
jgi:hypothetical protein